MEVILGPLSAIPPGEGRAFEVNNEKIAVFHTRSGSVYAVQNACPHRGGPLADGLVGGHTVICPLHSLKYDLSTGAPILGDCRLRTFQVRVDHAGKILLGPEKSHEQI